MKALKYKTLGALAFVQAVKTVNAVLAATAKKIEKLELPQARNCAHNYYTCVQLCKCMHVGYIILFQSSHRLASER